MQLKRVNWEKLSIAGLENTVWARLRQNEPSEEVIEFIQLEQSFSAIQKASSKEQKKPEKPAVMDPKKIYNLAILLGHLKMPFEEIKRALLAMDEKKFSESHLKQLLLYAPDSKELQKFKYFADDVSKLDKADRFCYEMSKVSWYKQRLKALLFKARFADKVEEIKPDLEAVLDASQELRTSPKLKKILELVLKMGNYMNKGNTRIGSAAAFKIEYLNKLSNTKTSDNKSTLLHFLVQTIESKCPEVLNIKDEIPSVATAAKVSGQMVSCEVEELSTGMKELQSDLGAFRSLKSQDSNDRFSEAVKSIIADTEGELNDLLSLQDKSTSEFHETVKFFGEKPSTATTEDFFGIFAAFIMNFERAHAENKTKLKLKEEQAKREQQKQERAKQRQLSLERSMSDSVMESKEELKKAVEAVKRQPSLINSEQLSTVSPSSSLSGSFDDTDLKVALADSDVFESMPADWTVVDVGEDTSPREKPSKNGSEVSKPPVSPRPKPAPPPKPKPKSPVSDRGNSGKNFIFPATTSAGNDKSSRNGQPKTPETTASPKRFSDYVEIPTGEPEIKKTAAASPSAGVKSKMSLFEGGGPVKPPVYAKPDFSKKTKAAKGPIGNDPIASAVDISKEEITTEVPPSLPKRLYTQEDLRPLTPSPKPSPPPAPVRENPRKAFPTENGLDSSKPSESGEDYSENSTENPYEVVEPRNVKPLSSVQQKYSVVPSPPPHQKRIESRKDMPPAPPSPFKDRVPPPPVRGVSLPSVSTPPPPKQNFEPEYTTVAEAKSSPPKSESPYSEVEDKRNTVEVKAYFTTDVVRNLPTKGGVDAKRQPPAKPPPYKMNKTMEGAQHAQAPSGVENAIARVPPPIPAPYRPKTLPGNLTTAATSSDSGQLQSTVNPESSHLPTVEPGSPRLHSAKLVSGSSPSSTSSRVIRSPPNFKPPPPPRVSSVADPSKEEVTVQPSFPDNRAYWPVNGIAEREEVNEIPTRDFNAVSPSAKQVLIPKPQLGSTPKNVSEEDGPPSFKPAPPPEFMPLVLRAYGGKSGTVTSNLESAGSQNDTDSIGIIAPPSLDWLDAKDKRSTSATSVDSLDLKIVPPPPVHLKELDPVNLTFELPPPDWQEDRDQNANMRTPKRGPLENGNISDYDLPIVPPPPPPSDPPPTLPLSGLGDYELDLVPSLLSGGTEGLNINDILGDQDKSLSLPSDRYDGISDDEDFLPPAPLPPGERYFGVPPLPVDSRIKPLVPPLRKQR